MIVGLGIELVEVARFRRALRRFGDRLRRRLFTKREWRYASTHGQEEKSLAARFAAKCAARRALGANHLAWRDIEVMRDREGPPSLRLYGRAARAAQDRRVARISLALSHDVSTCVAQVVLESQP